ncbi:MAG: hypothetical protein RIQ94_2493 [Pseudomonadota bacterium]|jgi:hypothetical protein
MPTKSSRLIYQLKITLIDTHPPIWRRVCVPGNFNLYQLHQVIQAAMGWTDSHLHQFIIDGEFYSVPFEDEAREDLDESRFKLERISPSIKRKFVYEYDFGDSWRHQIVVEKILPDDPNEKYPQCIKGKRACPPEDVGGVWGYETFLEALQNEQHEEHDSYLEWIGGEFDPEELDMIEINQDMSLIK